jgi:hypothetical protein
MYAELKPEGVHVIRNRLKALAARSARKAVFRWDKPAVFIKANLGEIVVVIILRLWLIPLNIAHDILPAEGL